MGCHQNIGFDKFPKQGSFLGQRARVVFNYDTSRELEGDIIRDDEEEPGLMIIHLDNGRVVLSTECQWSPIPAEARSR